MAEEKVTKEIAENEFLQWCEENDLETDEAGMSEDQKTVFTAVKSKFIKLIQKGRLVVDGSTFELTLSKFAPEGIAGTTVSVSHPTGSMWIGMDGRKQNEQMHKTQQAMSALTGKDTGWLSKIDAKDWGFLAEVVGLFLS